jgi:hypothetical protein
MPCMSLYRPSNTHVCAPSKDVEGDFAAISLVKLLLVYFGACRSVEVWCEVRPLTSLAFAVLVLRCSFQNCTLGPVAPSADSPSTLSLPIQTCSSPKSYPSMPLILKHPPSRNHPPNPRLHCLQSANAYPFPTST